jgi:hypothetical protein
MPKTKNNAPVGNLLHRPLNVGCAVVDFENHKQLFHKLTLMGENLEALNLKRAMLKSNSPVPTKSENPVKTTNPQIKDSDEIQRMCTLDHHSCLLEFEDFIEMKSAHEREQVRKTILDAIELNNCCSGGLFYCPVYQGTIGSK